MMQRRVSYDGGSTWTKWQDSPIRVRIDYRDTSIMPDGSRKVWEFREKPEQVFEPGYYRRRNLTRAGAAHVSYFKNYGYTTLDAFLDDYEPVEVIRKEIDE